MLDIQLLRDSFAAVVPIAKEVSDKFYEFLFTDYPEAKTMFENVDMDKQKDHLVKSLSYIVDNLDKETALTEFLKNMGARHSGYGVTPDHYPLVGNTLLKTFAHFFGENWTHELQEQWAAAYNFITITMLEGSVGVEISNQSEPSNNEAPVQNLNVAPEQIINRAKSICDNLLHKVLEEQINDELKSQIREKVRQVLLEVLEEESEQLLNFKKSA